MSDYKTVYQTKKVKVLFNGAFIEKHIFHKGRWFEGENIFVMLPPYLDVKYLKTMIRSLVTGDIKEVKKESTRLFEECHKNIKMIVGL